MTWVAGVDGCHGGWFVALLETGPNSVRRGTLLRHISEICDLPEKPQIIAVDIPIGLLNEARHGGRECDRITREILGQPRARSVFSPPVRAALRNEKYDLALAENRRSSPEHIGISQQCFGLFHKIRQVDEWINPRKQKRVREVHPELCFYELAGGSPMRYGKRDARGLGERRELLYNDGFQSMIEKSIMETRRGDVAEDDILDACVACWTATRILNGKSGFVPESQGMLDSEGLKMQIWR